MMRSAALLAVLLALTMCGPLPSPPPPSGAAAPVTADLLAMEEEAHRLVNRHRSRLGLPPLAYDPRLAEIARRHSVEMAARRRPFGHDGFDERAAEVQQIFAIRSMAENVAFDTEQPAAEHVVQNWLASPGHRANIEGRFSVTGIGAGRAPDGRYYFTQIFVITR